MVHEGFRVLWLLRCPGFRLGLSKDFATRQLLVLKLTHTTDAPQLRDIPGSLILVFDQTQVITP